MIVLLDISSKPNPKHTKGTSIIYRGRFRVASSIDLIKVTDKETIVLHMQITHKI